LDLSVDRQVALTPARQANADRLVERPGSGRVHCSGNRLAVTPRIAGMDAIGERGAQREDAVRQQAEQRHHAAVRFRPVLLRIPDEGAELGRVQC
jgi:hypothetical protein